MIFKSFGFAEVGVSPSSFVSFRAFRGQQSAKGYQLRAHMGTLDVQPWMLNVTRNAFAYNVSM